MTAIRWTLWLLLTFFTLLACLLAAFVIRDEAMDRVLRAGVLIGLTWMAADLASVVRDVPWKHRHKWSGEIDELNER